MSESVRVDAWLWAIRVYKTRSAATTACRAGHVRVNGAHAKAAQLVRPGDELRVRVNGFDRILAVRQTIATRVSVPPPDFSSRTDCPFCRLTKRLTPCSNSVSVRVPDDYDR